MNMCFADLLGHGAGLRTRARPMRGDHGNIVRHVIPSRMKVQRYTRALLIVVLPCPQGRGTGMKGEPYSALKSMRFWRCHAGDAGVAAVV